MHAIVFLGQLSFVSNPTDTAFQSILKLFLVIIHSYSP
jgi:hypothetical protein